MDLNLYEANGYLDMGAVITAPYPFIVAVGCRGCGKTYGSLKYAYESGKKFMYLRRTKTMLEIVCDPLYNPFKPVNKDLHINMQPSMGKGFGTFNLCDEDGNFIEFRGYAAALSTFANIRGFDGSDIELIIWDEFIPEPSETVKFDEYSAFCNAVETVNRNRELNGGEPVKVVMLSNSNLIYGGIVAGFHLGDELLYMQETGTEILEHSPEMLIVRPASEIFREQKKETALYKLTAGTGFSRMALENQFTIEDREKIRRRPLSEYIPVATISGMYIYKHKTNGTWYIAGSKSGSPKEYKDTETDKRRYLREQAAVWKAFCRRKVYFESIDMQDIFFDLYS